METMIVISAMEPNKPVMQINIGWSTNSKEEMYIKQSTVAMAQTTDNTIKIVASFLIPENIYILPLLGFSISIALSMWLVKLN